MSNEITTPAAVIQRDRWNRPLVKPVDGGKAVPHTRATVVAKAMDDLHNLIGWSQRMTAVGLAKRPDLLLAVQAIADPEADKKKLGALADAAKEAAAASAAATSGTAFHSLTETYDLHGEVPGNLDGDIAASMKAYIDLVEPLTFTAVEQFLVCDELQAAGTADRIVVIDGVKYIADLKTGKTLKYSGVAIAIQLAIYAHGALYDPETHQRAATGVDLERAVVIHVPLAQPGVATMHWVDIKRGWELAQLAKQVRDARKLNGLIANGGPEAREVPLMNAIADCRTAEALTALWAERKDEWNETATVAAAAQLKNVQAASAA